MFVRRFSTSLIRAGAGATALKESVAGENVSAISYALSLNEPQHVWTKEQLAEIYHTPLMELMHQAQLQHRKWHDLHLSVFLYLISD